MGDVFTRPEEDTNGMAHVVRPRTGLLRDTLGGLGAHMDEQYAAIQSEQAPWHMAERARTFTASADRALADIVRARPDIHFCFDPFDGAAVVYQRLRLRRRAALRLALRGELAHRPTGVFLRAEIDAYNALVVRAGRSALDPQLPRDAAVLRDRIAADGGSDSDLDAVRRRLLLHCVGHLHDDVVAYHVRSGIQPMPVRPRNPPPPVPPPIRPNQTPQPQPQPPPAKRPRVLRSPPIVATVCAAATTETCAVCMDAECAPRLPCGHKCMCAVCTASVDRCPMCRDVFDPSEVAWRDACGDAFVPTEGSKK